MYEPSDKKVCRDLKDCPQVILAFHKLLLVLLMLVPLLEHLLLAQITLPELLRSRLLKLANERVFG